jgi:hypothetical protein
MIDEDWAPRGYELWQNSAGCWQVYNDRGGWPWTDGVRHLIESIENQTPPLITPEHAYHVLEIMVKTMESGRTGKALAIESTFTGAELMAYSSSLRPKFASPGPNPYQYSNISAKPVEVLFGVASSYLMDGSESTQLPRRWNR